MAAQLTPSKQVRHGYSTSPVLYKTRRAHSDRLTDDIQQAASSLENLKMSDSPVKKLNFEPSNKENAPVSSAPVEAAPTKVELVEKPANEAPKVAPGIKDFEASEPLLQENPHRFVLFPIKYHEVSHVDNASTRIVVFTYPIGEYNGLT